jgi:hypothetical protein
MQITELLRLTKGFKESIVNKKIPQQYQQLFNVMNQNARTNNNQAKQPFESQREALFKSLKTVTLNKLTLEQIKFLDQLGITELLGSQGIKNIESILFENNLDIATAAKKVREFNTKITNAQSTLAEIETTLTKSFSIDQDDDIPEDSVMMRVYFQDESSINNISDFKKLASIWYDIGRGLAMAQNKSPEDFNIVGAQKGSLIIEMAVIARLAISVSTILLAGLKVAERVIVILKKAEELKALKLNNKKIEQEIKKEAEEEKKNGIATILEAAIIELGLSKEQDGDKITSLERSITKLIDFTQKGGAVDFVQPDVENMEEENDVRNEIIQLKENVQNIRLLENKIKMLESKLK